MLGEGKFNIQYSVPSLPGWKQKGVKMPFIICKNPFNCQPHQRVPRSKLRNVSKALADQLIHLDICEDDYLCNTCRMAVELKIQTPNPHDCKYAILFVHIY